MNKNKYNNGFTLIELSIVIIIIALITAGIFAGQHLVQQAQLRSIISEQEKIKTALNAFKLQYDALPGDISNASVFWPSCGASASQCNGNGNKIIEVNTADYQDSETYRAWQHMALARLYNGAFTGEGKDATAHTEGIPNVNIPESAYNNVGITLIYDNSSNNSATSYDSDKNIILFGGSSTGDIAKTVMFAANDALSVERKIDDSFPTTGILLGGAATCNNAGNYNLGSSGQVCNMAFTF